MNDDPEPSPSEIIDAGLECFALQWRGHRKFAPVWSEGQREASTDWLLIYARGLARLEMP